MSEKKTGFLTTYHAYMSNGLNWSIYGTLISFSVHPCFQQDNKATELFFIILFPLWDTVTFQTSQLSDLTLESGL